jgi:hypothetical protein
MADRDEYAVEPPASEPAPDQIAVRRRSAQSRIGRLIRLRSWLTVLVGMIALALLAFMLAQTK